MKTSFFLKMSSKLKFRIGKPYLVRLILLTKLKKDSLLIKEHMLLMNKINSLAESLFWSLNKKTSFIIMNKRN